MRAGRYEGKRRLHGSLLFGFLTKPRIIGCFASFATASHESSAVSVVSIRRSPRSSDRARSAHTPATASLIPDASTLNTK